MPNLLAAAVCQQGSTHTVSHTRASIKKLYSYMHPPPWIFIVQSCNSQQGFLELTLLLAARSAAGSR
eukprot:COSAG01_NODE_5447_length_4258_cov_13.569127_1_plen_66_part_10